ncbi:Re/Si-specific NAD(P)(+) transhydrogenase subunit alpha [Candidatus Phycosocius spiralis]|uniref:proton-translocating NAD(P)(+) transhydrogenase n=1 Tax=Candidatus Phycosocius spiralis TaxID=2815099 RepID=A0ABQ4PU36_9PROT|nr:Re/Si-specific NAD(P)(+) transhydrogenase subunit alpha [Candidatus Phycosocius spiralis]GIU66496.1 NAD(P) transhydrogenase subunit alpha [Candidatus Phycosocius spiralis]
MRIAILKETRDKETRVAASPETVKKLVAAGHALVIEAGAGDHAATPDSLFVSAGAEITKDAKAALKGAELVLKVRRPSAEELKLVPKGAGVVAFWNPHGDKALIEEAAKAGIIALSMEFTPRITRAQAMDALSSQANLAGYRAVIEGAALYGRGFPMMMTAAGTVAAAKCFVMGAGVAGLQAIATARRLGAIVTATDVRPASKEQVASLGAKFIAVEDDEFKAAETAAGYAKPMSAEYQAKQAILVGEHIAKQDVVITTALIPGRPAPVLVTPQMVAKMKPGSVVIDLAVEQGGNCPLSKADEIVVTDNGVTIAGFANLPGRLAADSSALYAKNLLNLLPLLTDEASKGFAPHFDDDIIKGMLLTRDGAVVHPSLISS